MFELLLAAQAHAIRRRETQRMAAGMTASLMNMWSKRKVRAAHLMSGPTQEEDARAFNAFSPTRPRVTTSMD